MEGLDLAVPLIISEESSLAFALHCLAKSGDEFFPKCCFRVVGGELRLFTIFYYIVLEADNCKSSHINILQEYQIF